MNAMRLGNPHAATGRRTSLGVARRVTALGILLAATANADDWPQIMGLDRNGVSREAGPPPPAGELLPLWSRKVGAGFAGPVVAGDLVVLFHREGNNEIVEAIHRNSGRTHWRSSYSTAYRDDFGFDEGPRSPATMQAGRVFTYGAQGRLSAFNLNDGRLLWQVDTQKEFGSAKGFFGAAGSPLVIGDAVLANIGGKQGAGIVAFAARTGKVLWSTTNDEASYSSGIAIGPASGISTPTQRAAFFTREGLAITNANSGALTHSYPWRSRLRSSVNASLPLVVDGKVFLSASYGTGAVMLDIGKSPPTQVWTSKEALASHYAPIIATKGSLYGIHGRVEYGGELRSIDQATGAINWSESTGPGSLIAVGDRLLVLLDSGELLWLEANSKRFVSHAKRALFQSTTRALPAYSNGVLFARDTDTLAAWQLGPSSPAP